MAKRYFIELSRRDMALVSYFPGTEGKDDQSSNWAVDVLIPAALALAKRKAAAIREMPITFWLVVRRTARRKAEVFLFVTPSRMLVRVKEAVETVLRPIQDGKVNAGVEPIPVEAIPFCQVFRGKVLMLYTVEEEDGGRWLPLVEWRNGSPRMATGRIPDDDVNEVSDDGRMMLVEARLDDVSSGEDLRKFQQALVPIARETK
jgi:hypothetical protein